MKIVLYINRTLLQFTFLFLITLATLLSSTHVFADGYQPLAPAIPGVSTANVTTAANLGTYLESLFEVGVSVAGALAVIMIIIGGIQYMSTDAIGGKEEGKEKITQAIWGLLLALVAFLILNTINPQLVSNNLGTTLTTASGGSVSNAVGDNTATINPVTGTINFNNGTSITNPGSNNSANTINLGNGVTLNGTSNNTINLGGGVTLGSTNNNQTNTFTGSGSTAGTAAGDASKHPTDAQKAAAVMPANP